MCKECKRFGKGSIFEDMECMLCDVYNDCNAIAHEEKIKYRREKTVNDICKTCSSISNCKHYIVKHKCDYKYIPSSIKLGYSRCSDCNCKYNCIEKYNQCTEFTCIKDIDAKTHMFGHTISYTKDNKYKFIIVYYNHKGEDYIALYDIDKCDFITYDFTSILINYIKPSYLIEMEKMVAGFTTELKNIKLKKYNS